jgi:hypothetical protein
VSKNLSIFCLCPKNLWEADLKEGRIIDLIAEHLGCGISVAGWF